MSFSLMKLINDIISWKARQEMIIIMKCNDNMIIINITI